MSMVGSSIILMISVLGIIILGFWLKDIFRIDELGMLPFISISVLITYLIVIASLDLLVIGTFLAWLLIGGAFTYACINVKLNSGNI